MPEVPVAFPNDEASAEGSASALRAAGIAARIDRGLHGSWQVPAQGQMTVFVNARDAARAHKLLGTTRREESAPSPLLRLAIAFLIGGAFLGVVAILASFIR